MHIRAVRESDAEAIALILNGIIETGKYSALDIEVTVEAEQKSIAAFPSRGIFSVAEITENQKIAGFYTPEPFGTYTHAFDHVPTIGT